MTPPVKPSVTPREALSREGSGAAESGDPGPSASGARWESRVGVPPLVVLAYERPERRGLVFARWTDPGRSGRDRRRKRSLNVGVRDDAGRLDPGLVAVAEAKLRALHTDLVAERAAGLPTAPTGGASPGPLTLEAGYALALRPGGAGLYARDSRQRRDVQRAAATAMGVLGRDAAWAEVTPARAAEIWRGLAAVHAATGRSGPRHAEVVVSSLYTVAAWLRDGAYLPEDVCRPGRGWRARLRAEWGERTGRAVAPARPRHTPAELRAILAALPYAEPRLRLAVELGAELRLGQVLGVTRRDLGLAPTPECPHGRVVVRGRGRKRGGVVVLTAEQRAAVDDALAGYLREHEEAYQTALPGAADAGAPDYPLFPGGKLARGVARARPGPRVLSRRAALALFHALETTAGVTPVKGRGWYGLRRLSADLAPEDAGDDRVLDRVGGHGRDTRTRVYQDRTAARRARAASDVRRRLPGGAPGPTSNGTRGPFDHALGAARGTGSGATARPLPATPPEQAPADAP